MKKIIGLLAILSFTVACKDVEKNPGGCDYGYTSDGAGECLSSEYSYNLKINDANKNLYGRNLVLKYINSNNGDYDLVWLTAQLREDMLKDGIITKLVEIEYERPKLQLRADELHTFLEGIYYSVSVNTWDEQSKARAHSDILDNPPIQQNGLFDRPISDYTVSELAELSQKKQNLLNRLEALADQSLIEVESKSIRRNSDRGYIDVLNVFFNPSSTVLTNTNKSIEESPECEGRVYECKVELQQEIEELFNDLYHSTYKNLF